MNRSPVYLSSRFRPRRTPADIVLPVVFLLAACVLFDTCVDAQRAQGQAADTTATTLARFAIGESGWHEQDQAAALHVIGRRAARAGVSVEAMVLRYSAVFAGNASPRTRWVLAIERDCAQPAAWPSNLAWSRYEPKCRDTFARVERFLAGTLPDPCPRATQFGSKRLNADIVRARRAIEAGRWRLARCSMRLANNFYSERGR